MNKRTYDYVIVGGGSAGCVIAARLSEDPHVDVLLLEAGGRDIHPLISIPLGMGKMNEYRMFDWGYETEPEPALGGRRVEARRGKVLGGCSTINVMAYTRGNPGDFDRWARNGATGWSYGDVLPYFRRGETFERGADQFRGGDGPVGTEFAKTPDPIFDAWVEAGKQAGFPVTPRLQRPAAGRFRPRPVHHPRRPAFVVLARLSASDPRPAQSHRRDGRPRAQGHDRGQAGDRRRICQGRSRLDGPRGARGHLVGGRVQYAAIADAVGHRPGRSSQQMGITPIVDLPGVGKNLQDHLGIWITWNRTLPGRFHGEMRFDRMATSMLRAYFLGSGPGTVVPGGLHAYVKVQKDVEVPDIEFMFHTVPPQTRLWFPGIVAPYQDAYAIRPTLLHPGKPRRNPAALGRFPGRAAHRLQLLLAQNDMPRLVAGFKRAREVGEQPAMAPYRGVEASPGPECRTDADIEAFIRRTTITAHHPCGTCKMGDDSSAPLDPALRLRGVAACASPTPRRCRTSSRRISTPAR